MEILQNLGNITIIVELIATGVVVVYSVYAFLVMRQTKMLNSGFHSDSERILNYLATGQFLATIALVFIGLIIVLI